MAECVEFHVHLFEPSFLIGIDRVYMDIDASRGITIRKPGQGLAFHSGLVRAQAGRALDTRQAGGFNGPSSHRR